MVQCGHKDIICSRLASHARVKMLHIDADLQNKACAICENVKCWSIRAIKLIIVPVAMDLLP